MNQISERYAEAVFDLAKEENKLKEYKEEAKSLSTLITADVIHFFGLKKVSKEEKKECIREWFKDYSDTMRHLLCLLVDVNRSAYTTDILKTFISKCNEALNIKEVKVYSARKLEEKNRQEIINAISNQYKSDVELIEYINPELVAGIKVVIGGKEIDTTFRKRVDLMKKELLKEGW